MVKAYYRFSKDFVTVAMVSITIEVLIRSVVRERATLFICCVLNLPFVISTEKNNNNNGMGNPIS